MNDGHLHGFDGLHTLVQMALAGDKRARELVVKLCNEPIRQGVQEVFRGNRSKEDVEDCIGRAFVDLLAGLPRLQKQDSLLGFARQIGYYSACKFLSKYNWERELQVDIHKSRNAVTDAATTARGAEEDFAQHELLQRAREHLQPSLNSKEMQVFELNFVQGFAIQEIADRLGLKRNNVDQILHKLRKLLAMLARQLDPD